MSIEGITANLTPKNFYRDDNGNVFVKNSSGNPGLLLIHATWCGHCKRFKPVFQSLCAKLNRKNIDDFPCFAIEDSDLSEKPELVKALNFRGYPTIKFFDQYGKLIGDYEGERSEPAILEQICQVYHHCITKH
jgi:thiol-disulfide isomerase/thioredoxin